ncbi:hypothetical protein QOZ80_5BG0410490 [Eleusine coracana subsp. coracana]|nr:hypothetical protein QOZ80_5BG0410490 [Eleusine coracana subsp. coracana]
MASLVLSQPRHSVQTYWARRNYQRLGSPSRRLRVARLGGGGRKQRAAGSAPWKKKLTRAALRLRAAVASARLLARLRDAYVDAMLALAGGVGRPCAALARTRSCAPEAGLLARRVPRARTQRGSSDFERRMMAHIYSAVVTPELPRAGRQ